MKKYLLIILVASFLFWITYLSFYQSSYHNKPPKNTKISKNLAYSDMEEKNIIGKFTAIDGDSLKLGQEHSKSYKEIRIKGIDAPEYRQECFDSDKKPYNCGKKSHKFLKKLIKNKEIICKYKQKDIYDRYLADCFIKNDQKDINIAEKMLKNGMAIIYNIHYADKKTKSIEKYARDNKIGIWQGKFISPKDYRKFKHEK